MIELSINGQARQLPEGTTVADLVAQLESGPRGIAVVVNAEVVPRSVWPDTPVTAGDRVEVLRAAQGGC